VSTLFVSFTQPGEDLLNALNMCFVVSVIFPATAERPWNGVTEL
jgi:hypothetical protein